jgi:flagellar motility protein MotE (MotC chaperone)
VLIVVAGFLLASGILRLGDGTGLALARELGALASAASAASHETSEDTPGLEDLLAALRARELRVTEAEARLDERSMALAIAEEEIQRNLVALTDAEQSLRDLVTVADSAAEQDIARLTAMYEAMKPAEAAALFDQMDPAFAAGFLGRMRADAAAPILAGLPPEKAYALSVVLASRNATVKTE